MIKCDCYHKEFGKEVCYGTKEMEECTCGGDVAKCDFYPTRRVNQIVKEKPIDILTLMRKLYSKGYELDFSPDSMFDNCMVIALRDVKSSRLRAHCTKIFVNIGTDYLIDPNGAIFENIDAMIENMDGDTWKGSY